MNISQVQPHILRTSCAHEPFTHCTAQGKGYHEGQFSSFVFGGPLSGRIFARHLSYAVEEF